MKSNVMDPKRKLAAILSSDVVGYSRLMGEDERATLETLTAWRKVMAEAIESHGGRVVDSPGDALLAEFPSAVEAVQSAVEIQSQLLERNAPLSEHRRMLVRIGLNLGDVMEQDGALYGDGVNIAARLEALADPGGICISGTVFDQVEGKLPLFFQSVGEQSVKNIAKPVRAYHVVIGAGRPAARRKGGVLRGRRRELIAATLGILALGVAVGAAWQFARPRPGSELVSQDAVLAMPTGAVVAVLPFANLSGDAKDDYFSDGLTEEIITELARFRELNVLARNTTFQYKGKSVDVPAIGRQLGAKYVLEGSVRKSTKQLRVTAQLIDAQTGSHVWAERFDRDIRDVFAVQDEIAGKIAAIVTGTGGVLLRAGREASARKRPDQLQAYDYLLRATMSLDRWTPDGYKQSKAELEKAIALDPTYGRARQAYAWLMLIGWFYQYEDAPAPPRQIKQNAIKSIDLDPGDARAHRTAAFGYFLDKQLELFAKEARIALELAPNDADILVELGALFVYNGQWDRGVPLITKAYKLNPDSASGWYHSAMFWDFYRRGQYEQALEMVRLHPLVQIRNEEHCKLIALYGELGRRDKAQEAWNECRAIDPKFSVQWEIEFLRLWNVPEDMIRRIVESYAKAGFT